VSPKVQEYLLILPTNSTHMDLKEILSVSGKSGLFKIISQTKNGLIVESLLDKKRIPVYASDKISNLEEISIYTDDKEAPLKDVFKAIFDKESGGKTIDHKSEEKLLREYFVTVLPNYDKERVYASDIKKVVNWYNILLDNGLMTFEEEKQPEEAVEKNPDEQPPIEEKQ
jgi:hypothetical protein